MFAATFEVGMFSKEPCPSNNAFAASSAFFASSSPCINFVISNAATFLASFICSFFKLDNLFTSSIGKNVRSDSTVFTSASSMFLQY